MEAIDRYGNKYNVRETVTLKDFPVLYKTLIGQPIEIVEIKEYKYCESGHMLLLKHVESGNVFKKWLDTNWVQKIKQ